MSKRINLADTPKFNQKLHDTAQHFELIQHTSEFHETRTRTLTQLSRPKRSISIASQKNTHTEVLQSHNYEQSSRPKTTRLPNFPDQERKT